MPRKTQYDAIEAMLAEEEARLEQEAQDDEFASFEQLDQSGTGELCDECGTALEEDEALGIGTCPKDGRRQRLRKPREPEAYGL